MATDDLSAEGGGDKPTDRLIGYDEAAQAIADVGSMEDAAEKMADLSMRILDKLPPDERQAKIEALHNLTPEAPHGEREG